MEYMPENIIIPNPENLEKTKKAIKEAGLESLHILTDFDRTLIKAFVNGKNVVSIMSILRDGSHLAPGYAQKAHSLFDKYRPIELDPNISSTEKRKLMHQWWQEHFKILIELKLNKKDIKEVVGSDLIQFRDGFSEFIDFLQEKRIPLVIMSSSGLGIEAIKMCLARENKLNENIFVISNDFEWDENGNAIAVKQPIIHAVNKDEFLVQDFPEIFEAIKNRKNVLLLGDSLDDIGAIEGFEYDNLIKIGFLNEKEEELLKHYEKTFDVVILNDGPMDYVNELLNFIAR